MGVGEMGVGEMGVGEMAPIRKRRGWVYSGC